MKDVDIQIFEGLGWELDKARKKYFLEENQNDKVKAPQPTQKLITKPKSVLPGTGTVLSGSESTNQLMPLELEDNSKEASAKILMQLRGLDKKIDKLSLDIKSLSIGSINREQKPQQPLNILNTEVNWKDIKDIAALCNSVRDIRFYPGKEGGPSVVRCETCFNLLADRHAWVKKSEDASRKALRGIGQYSGSLSSGLLLDDSKCEALLNGGNQQWYDIKTTIKKHIGCTGPNSVIHFEALQHEIVMKKREARSQKVAENLVRIALEVIKTKAAGLHFEDIIASHVATGSDLGDIGHSKNHFNEIMACMNVWLDFEVGKILSNPLQGTGFNPHFYVSCDKSTPARATNHAIMICPIVNGVRVAIPVNSPEVYAIDRDKKGAVTGGTAGELAGQIVKCLKEAYTDFNKFDLASSWIGTCCDRQYQAAGFFETIHSELEQPSNSTYSEVIWDQSHWMNLAILDVRDNKVGSSGEYLKRLINRAKNIHTMFNRGKMLSNAMALAKEKQISLKFTKGSCSTRFWTSQYNEFKVLIKSFAAYGEAFCSFGYSEIKEYEILGQDFVLDLCAVVDCMEVVMNLMVDVQALSCPCWKMCVWFPRVKKILQEIEDESILEPAKTMKNLFAHVENILIHETFQDQKLVTGWRLVSTNDGNDNWEAREPEDCEQDARTFIHDIISSMEARFDNCVGKLSRELVCFDFENIVTLLCGKRRNGRPVISEGDLEEYYLPEFRRFVEYACSLKHIKAAIQEGDLQLDGRLSHVIYRNYKMFLKNLVWESNEAMKKCFSIEENGEQKSLSAKSPSSAGKLSHLEVCKEIKSHKTYFEAQFSGFNETYIITVNEEAIIKMIYTEEESQHVLGKEFCLLFDIGMGKGGRESIVESYYSVMESQKKFGGQTNDTLSLRTKLYWCLPNVLQADRMVKEVSRMYLQGDGLRKHRNLIICNKQAKLSKVLKKIKASNTGLHFLQ
eukprot:gene8335-biopygen6173